MGGPISVWGTSFYIKTLTYRNLSPPGPISAKQTHCLNELN